jgi:valyl-tRNA synthetase
MHPFMPFLMWQRLPRRRGDCTKSIVTATYPQYDSELDDPLAAEQYELLVGCSKSVRSLMAEYSIKDNGKGMQSVVYPPLSWPHGGYFGPGTISLTDQSAFVQTFDDKSYNTTSLNLASIKSLAGKGVSSIEVLSPTAAPPIGCSVFVVSSSAAVLLEVRGRVVIKTEIQKALTKLDKTRQGVVKQKKIMEAWGDDEQKVSETVRKAAMAKLKGAEAEMRNYERSIENFERLKLEEAQTVEGLEKSAWIAYHLDFKT